ncbi:MAG: hypothetical protein WC006_00150 [Bacilli bacterium]
MKSTTRDLLGLLAFISLLIFTASFILNRIGAQTSFFTYAGYGLALIVVLGIAKVYVDKLSMTWKIVFYIIAIFAILDYLFSIF